MQCKNISTTAILNFLAKNPDEWHNWYFNNDRDVRCAMLSGFTLPDNLVLAKMRMLIKKGLVDGCSCGCRGDFVITNKGLSRLGEL